MSSGGSATIGFQYMFDIHMGLGRGPVDALVAIKVADRIAWQGSNNATGPGRIDAPQLFGGDEKEGGIEGDFYLMMGEPDQVPPEGVNALQPEGVVAGFRRMCTLFYSGLVCSINPYPKAWSMRVRRALKGWDGEVFRPDLAIIWLGGDETGESATDKVFDKIPFGKGAESAPPHVHFSKGGKLLAVSRGDMFVRQDDASEPNIYTGLPRLGDAGDEANLTLYSDDAAFSPDGNFFIAGSSIWYRSNNNFNVMNSDDFITPFMNGVVALDFHPGSKHYAMAGADGLRVYAQFVNKWYGTDVLAGTSNTRAVDWHRGGKYLVIGRASAPFMRVYRQEITSSSSNTPEIAGPDVQPEGRVNDMAWSYDGLTLAVAMSVAPYLVLYAFDPDTGVLTRKDPVAEPPAGPANGVTWRPNGQQLAVAHNDAPFISIYNVEEGVLTKRPPLDKNITANATSIEWNDTGDVLAVGHELDASGTHVTLYGRSRRAGSAYESDTNIMAMNPAHIIYECLTNREWGRGLGRNMIDTAAFEEAAQQLFDEGFGLCIKWARRDSIQVFVQAVLDHINATLYSDRETALLKLKLIRGGYDRNSLPLYDTTNGILEIRESTTTTISGAVNEVVVTYLDPVQNEEKMVRVQNLATLQSTGGSFLSMAKSYTGIPTADLALRVAQRDLRANAEGLRRFTLLMNRTAWRIAPGDVIRIQDPTRNVPDMVVRVARIEDGNAANGAITLTVVQDVFTLPRATFVESQPNTWAPPDFQPCIGRHQVFEAPYFMLSRVLPRADAAAIDAASAYLTTVVEQGQAMNSAYDIAVRHGASTGDDAPTNTQAYCGYQP